VLVWFGGLSEEATLVILYRGGAEGCARDFRVITGAFRVEPSCFGENQGLRNRGGRWARPEPGEPVPGWGALLHSRETWDGTGLPCVVAPRVGVTKGARGSRLVGFGGFGACGLAVVLVWGARPGFGCLFAAHGGLRFDFHSGVLPYVVFIRIQDPNRYVSDTSFFSNN
jgi:hypothetical protein